MEHRVENTGKAAVLCSCRQGAHGPVRRHGEEAMADAINTRPRNCFHGPVRGHRDEPRANVLPRLLVFFWSLREGVEQG